MEQLPELAVASAEEEKLEKQAYDAFQAQSYESSLSLVNKLVELRPNDPRVQHNKAVAKYYLSNLTLTDDFRRSLQSISQRYLGSSVCLQLNRAIIMARLHQHWQAMELLEQVYECGGELKLQACSLLMELYLSTYQLEKAVKLVAECEQADGNAHHLHQFKARLFMAQRNLKGCKKEIKNLSIADSNSATHVAFLKANYEFLRGNFRKSVKLLTSTQKTPLFTEAGQCLPSLYFNNLGCLHYRMGKFTLACYYFGKALSENDSALKDFPPLEKATLSGRPLAVLGVNCRHILLYNLGLQHLYAGQPIAAFNCLLEAVQVFHTNPLLWLRIAEASIAAHKKGQLEYSRKQCYHSDTVQTVVGTGFHQKLVVMPMGQSPWQQDVSPAIPAPTLGFAAIALRTVLHLIPDTVSSDTCVMAYPSPPLRGEAIQLLRASTLANACYVSLGQGDPVTALNHVNMLINMSEILGQLRFLAHLYGAEAYVLLGRTNEALKLLSSDITNEEGSNNQVTLLLNLAAVFCMRRELEKAKKPLHQASTQLIGRTELNESLCARAVLLSAYIELHNGNVSGAIQLLRRHQTAVQFHFSASAANQDRKKLLTRRVLS